VQLEDKVVDNREEARTELKQREDVLARGEDQLPEPVFDALVDHVEDQLRDRLVGAIRGILDGYTVSINDLKLPSLHTRAMEAFKTAVDGRTVPGGQFVYASDRRDLLEQALGVLQPELTVRNDLATANLHAELEGLTGRVGELRHKLTDLEDSQDELLETGQKEALEATAEPGDKPKPKPPSDPDAPRPATTLTGPDLPEPAPPATSLTGPDLPPEPDRPTTLVGPEPSPAPRPATTLTGPDLPPEPDRPTTLIGPEPPPEPPPASMLTGEPEPPGEASTDKDKKSWWRRPFG